MNCDEEIIRALKICTNGLLGCRSDECPYFREERGMYCFDALKKDALDLINRLERKCNSYRYQAQAQKGELRRLNARNSELNALNKTASIDAIKSFAERLTDTILDKSDRSLDNPNGNDYFISDVIEDIDNLVKELTGNIPKIEHNSLCETETYKVGEQMDYDEEFIQEVEEATEKGLAVPYAIERLLRIIRKKGAEIEHWKAVTKAELDTIHKLGDDYGRVLEGMEECKAIIVQQQAENERLRSVLMEIVGD